MVVGWLWINAIDSVTGFMVVSFDVDLIVDNRS